MCSCVSVHVRVSYLFQAGQKYHNHLSSMVWPFCRSPRWLDRTSPWNAPTRTAQWVPTFRRHPSRGPPPWTPSWLTWCVVSNSWLLLDLSPSAAGAGHHSLVDTDWHWLEWTIIDIETEFYSVSSLTWSDRGSAEAGPGHCCCLSSHLSTTTTYLDPPQLPVLPAACRLEIPEIKQFIIEWNSRINDDHLKTVMFTSPLISIFKYL